MSGDELSFAARKFVVDFFALRLFYFLAEDLACQLRGDAPKLHRIDFNLKRLPEFRICIDSPRCLKRNLFREIQHNVNHFFRHKAPYLARVKVNLHRDIGIRTVDAARGREQRSLDCLNENFLR